MGRANSPTQSSRRIGVSAQVTVLAPAEIERSAGKARRVIDKRPKA